MSTSPQERPVEGLKDFLNYMWGKEQGFVYVPYKIKDTAEWKKVMYPWPKAEPQVITHILAQSAEGNDIYFAPVIFSEARPLKENVKGSHVLWADFDGTIPNSFKALDGDLRASTPDQAPGTREALAGSQGGTTPRTEASPGVPIPSLQVQSSTEDHQHVYWRLEEFTTDINWVEDTNRALAYTLKADTSGWDCNQVLRPPGTTNYKHGLEVTIIAERPDSFFNRANFATLSPVKQLVSEALDLQDIPDVTRVVAKYTWDDDHYELFMQKAVEEGHRSSALMKLGFFGAESGMTDGEIYSLLLNADDRWGKFKKRSDRKKRLLDIINRARQKHPTGLSATEGLLRSLDKDAPVSTPKYVFGFDEFLQTEMKIEWAYEDLLEVGGIGIISAQAGIGKTQLSIQLGISAALGIDFLKWTPTRKMKILFLSLEMSHPALKHFMSLIARQYSQADVQVLERNFKVVPLGEPLPLDHPDGRKFLESLLDEYKPDGIIFDSMGKVTNSSLSDEEKIKQLNAYYVHIRNKYNSFLWFIHHNRKATENNKKPTDLSDMYGNQYIAAETSVALNLWKNKDGTLEITTLKSRLAPELEPFLVTRNQNLTFSLDASENPAGEGLLSHIGNDEVKKSKPEIKSTPTVKKEGSKSGSIFEF